MKILYHHRIASKDGQYVHVEELTKALKLRGHEIITVAPKVAENGDFGSEGGLVPLLKRFVPGFAYELLELGYSFYAYLKLAKAVKKYKPDCLYERYQLFMPAGVWIKQRFGLPMLLEVNAPIFSERSKYNGITLPGIARWSEEYAWKGADVTLPVTKVLAEKISAVGVSDDHIAVIPNGIDPDKFNQAPDNGEAKRKLGIEDRLVLGFTGFIREWHALEQVLDLLTDTNNGIRRHLLIVGDGPARSSIEKKACDLGVSDKVTITGVVARDQVASYVAAFDVALQPDVVEYASPLKLFEYLALGRVIVAPDTPNLTEILEHKKNAFLFDQSVPDAFPKAVKILIDDAELREKLAQGAQETIGVKGLTWTQNAKKVEALFKILGVK